MSIDEYETAKELDDHAERIEELNREYAEFKQDVQIFKEDYEYSVSEVEDLKLQLKAAEDEAEYRKKILHEYEEKLEAFRNENEGFLI